jgi:hypothetical protein
MKPAVVAIGIVFVSSGASAHRLDQYLQATTLSVEKDRIQAQIRLTPGVAVLPFVLASIDTDADGLLSASEQRAYADRVLQDLSLRADGNPLALRLVSTKFPSMQEMKEGLGTIVIDFAADVPGNRHDRQLAFENHHQSPIAAYLVNCLIPSDPRIRVTGQNRNYEQSFYQLDYLQNSIRSGPFSLPWWSRGHAWVGSLVVLLLARLALLWRRRRAENAASQFGTAPHYLAQPQVAGCCLTVGGEPTNK